MLKHRKAVIALLALAVAGVFLLPASSASAGSSTVSNACANSVTPNFSQIEVTTSGDDGLTTVAPAGATTTSGLSQSAAIPGDIFVAGYNLGLLVQGTNNIPANVRSTIEATNTVQGSQNTNTVGGSPPNGSVTVTTVITDPDGVPGTGDETATDASFSVSYDNLNWTAGASGTIDYRQQSIAAAPPTAANNTLLINALVGGIFNVQFRCAPGTVTGPDPGVITLIDPAPSFDTTDIVVPDTAPTANAGNDQTVASGATVNLDGTGSSDPEGEALTHNWTQLSGPAVTLTGANTATPSFTAPTVAVPTTLEFQDEVCDEPPVLCDTDTVVITVNPPGASDISINDVSVTEGDSGQTAATFAVTLSAPQPAPVTVAFATSDGSATAPGDYASASGTVTFAAGDVSEPVTVQVNGDTAIEGDETFNVNLSSPTGNAAILDGLGVGTIVDDDVDDAPTADAGPAQTVDEGTLVTLAGSGTDPEGEALSFNWTAPAGITLSDPTSATPTFTAPDVSTPTAFTLTLEVCDEGPTVLCDTDTVVITVNPVFEVIVDAAGEVIVNGPVKAGATSKVYVFRISNVGNTEITIDPTTEIAAAVLVNGTADGSVTPITGTKTISPGARARFRLRWTGTTPLVAGDIVEFTADVNEPNDADTTNDADSQTRTAG
jgi:hypothetical protein